jgi:hypothetical protein
MPTVISEDQLIKLLEAAIAREGSASLWAQTHDFGPAYISRVRGRDKEPSVRLARSLGYRPKIYYEKIKR